MPTETTASLFTEPSNTAALRRFVHELHSLPAELIAPEGLTRNLVQIINLMISQAATFDKYASANVEWIGKHFFGEINNYFDLQMADKPAATRSILVSAYRFLCEVEFSQPGQPSFEVTQVMKFVHDNLDSRPCRIRLPALKHDARCATRIPPSLIL